MPVPTTSKADLYRKLPSVDELLHSAALTTIIYSEGHAAVTDAARTVLASLRAEIAAGRLDAAAVDLALSGIPDAVARQARQSLSYSLRTVINATGVILHTNLGRAPLAASALEHVREASSGYSNLEFDIESGQRGQRDVHVDRLFRKLLKVKGFAGERRPRHIRLFHYRRQQQRGRGPAGAEYAGGGRRSHRLARRAGRDRRIVPHP